MENPDCSHLVFEQAGVKYSHSPQSEIIGMKPFKALVIIEEGKAFGRHEEIEETVYCYSVNDCSRLCSYWSMWGHGYPSRGTTYLYRPLQ